MHLKQQDLEEISRRSELGTRFNFKSRKQRVLEQGKGALPAVEGESSTGSEEGSQIAMKAEGEEDADERDHSEPDKGPAALVHCCDAPARRCENGFYFITQGSCQVRNHDDGYCAKKLKQGDYFGEGDLLRTVGYTTFGEIVADSDDVECWFVACDDFWMIPLFEQMHMKGLAQARRDILMLSFDYCRRYKRLVENGVVVREGVTMEEYSSYYS